MRTVGIVAEYNPFHTGHAYHIRKAKELSEADYAVVVMSPDFVQRGEPAVFDKYTRTRMALQNGADLVIELPVCYATGSAEYFAEGSVAMLDRLGVVDTLCFGAETADPGLFSSVSEILAEEPPEYAELLRGLLREGKTYPQARSEALSRCLETKESGSSVSGFLSSPNNILGTEYCKALRKLHSRIVPLPVLRAGSRHENSSLEGSYCSAAALRKGISDGAWKIAPADSDSVQTSVLSDSGSARKAALSDSCSAWEAALLRHIPANCHQLFRQTLPGAVTTEELLPFLSQKLLACDSFDCFFDISPALSDRMRSHRCACIGKPYEQVVSLLKTRQITDTHIRRALLHAILGIRAEDVTAFRNHGTVFYAKVLGLKKDAAPLLHLIKDSCTVPFLTKAAHASALSDSHARRLWQLDLFASHLYRSIQVSHTHADFRSEYEISPVIL